jgi:hypothetical protein
MFLYEKNEQTRPGILPKEMLSRISRKKYCKSIKIQCAWEKYLITRI